METLVDFADCVTGEIDHKHTSQESLALLVGCAVSSIKANITALVNAGMLTYETSPGAPSKIVIDLDEFDKFGLVAYKRLRQSARRVGRDNWYNLIEKML